MASPTALLSILSLCACAWSFYPLDSIVIWILKAQVDHRDIVCHDKFPRMTQTDILCRSLKAHMEERGIQLIELDSDVTEELLVTGNDAGCTMNHMRISGKEYRKLG